MNLRLFPNLQSNLLMTAPSTWSETQTHVSSSRSLAWIQIQVSFFLFFFTKMMYGYIHMSNLTSDIQRTIDETVMLWPMAIWSIATLLSNAFIWFFNVNMNNFSWNVCLCVWYSQGKLLWLVFSHLHGGFAQSFPKKSSPSQVGLYS